MTERYENTEQFILHATCFHYNEQFENENLRKYFKINW